MSKAMKDIPRPVNIGTIKVSEEKRNKANKEARAYIKKILSEKVKRSKTGVAKI